MIIFKQILRSLLVSLKTQFSLKNIFTGIVFIIAVFYAKNSNMTLSILNIFNIDITENSVYFVSGFLGLIVKLSLRGILELLSDIIEINPGYMTGGGDNLPERSDSSEPFKAQRPLTLNKGSDSGGDDNSPSNSPVLPKDPASASSSRDIPSSVRTPVHRGVITESDYEMDSDDSNGQNYLSDSDDEESLVSKFINSSDFDKRVKTITVQELSETLDTIEVMKQMYQNSNVPSAKEQLAILAKKESICSAGVRNWIEISWTGRRGFKRIYE